VSVILVPPFRACTGIAAHALVTGGGLPPAFRLPNQVTMMLLRCEMKTESIVIICFNVAVLSSGSICAAT
jgi:hypothetical protein